AGDGQYGGGLGLGRRHAGGLSLCRLGGDRGRGGGDCRRQNGGGPQGLAGMGRLSFRRLRRRGRRRDRQSHRDRCRSGGKGRRGVSVLIGGFAFRGLLIGRRFGSLGLERGRQHLEQTVDWRGLRTLG